MTFPAFGGWSHPAVRSSLVILSASLALAAGTGGCGDRGRNLEVRTRILAPADVPDPYAGLSGVRISLWQEGQEVGTREFAVGDPWTLPKTTADLHRPVVIEVAGLGSAGTVAMLGRTQPFVPAASQDSVFGIFFAPPGTFALPPAAMNTPRKRAGVARLGDGRVVVAGGQDALDAALASVELYDPNAGTWTDLPSLATARVAPSVVELADGRVLIAGGESASGPRLAGTEILSLPDEADPSGAVVAGADMPFAAAERPGARLPSGRVLLAGGSADVAEPAPVLFDPVSGAWSTVSGADGAAGATLAVFSDGRIAVVGGIDGANAPLSRVQVFEESAGGVAVTAADALRVPRLGAAVAVVRYPQPDSPESLLVAGGNTMPAGAPTVAVELVAVDGAITASFAPDRDDVHRAFRAAVRLEDGRVLLAGGTDPLGGSSEGARLWDPTTGRVERTNDARVARRGQTQAVPMLDGTALLAGADDATEVEIYTPPVEPLAPASRVDLAVTPLQAVRASGEVLDGAATLRLHAFDGVSQVGTWSVAAGNPVQVPGFRVDDGGIHLVLEALDAAGTPLAWGATAAPLDEAAQQAATVTLLMGRTNEFNLAPGTLAVGREDPALGRLDDGRLVVVGGRSAGAPESADDYDPGTGAAGAYDIAPTVARSETPWTTLADGRLFIAGGTVGANSTSSATILDPASGAWAPATPVPTPVTNNTLVTLSDGDVFSHGNYDPVAGVPLRGSFRWNASTGAWTTLASTDKRMDHSSTLLDDGRVLVTGGTTSNGVLALSATARVYDPANDSFLPAGNMTTPRRGHVQFAVPGGDAVVCGGHSGLDATAPIASCERFDGLTFSLIPTNLSVPRHNACVIPAADGRVYVIGGGDTANTTTNAVDVWDPAAQGFIAAPSTLVPREEAVGVELPDGRIVVLAGENQGVQELDSVEILTPPSWKNPFGP